MLKINSKQSHQNRFNNLNNHCCCFEVTKKIHNFSNVVHGFFSWSAITSKMVKTKSNQKNCKLQRNKLPGCCRSPSVWQWFAAATLKHFSHAHFTAINVKITVQISVILGDNFPFVWYTYIFRFSYILYLFYCSDIANFETEQFSQTVVCFANKWNGLHQ